MNAPAAWLAPAGWRPVGTAQPAGDAIEVAGRQASHTALRRKLTAVMIADVVGYSRLMGRDEEGTHTRLCALRRDLLKPTIDAHAGILVNKTGDGLLAEFASVVEAVRCAIEIQEGAARRNAGLAPDRQIAFRIGINLGDIIVEADDIYGDSINVAARLQVLARPGSIVVSRAVRDHVRDRLSIGFEDLGEQRVKNIARPVRAFCVRPADAPPHAEGPRGRRVIRLGALAGLTSLAMVAAGGMWWHTNPGSHAAPTLAAVAGVGEPHGSGAQLPPRLSIVVLPFANLAGDPQQDYVADGITESLTTDLSRALPGSFVVARGAAFTYKGRPVDPKQVGRDLNVRYLLQGSVIPQGDRVRVNAQLIDGQTNSELWAERFDRMRKDVLEVQDEIVGRLSRAVGLQVIDIEARRSERERPSDPSAVDLVMRGQSTANRPASRETMVAARVLFQRALQHDSDNVDALAGVATTYVFEVLNSYYADGREDRLRQAEALLRRALAIDPRHIVALKAHAALLRAQGKFEEAIAASRVVVAQNPGEPWAHKEIGLSDLYLGRPHEALESFERADQIGPRDPSRWIWLGAMGRVQFFLGHDEEAIRLLRLSAYANPSDARAFALLASIYALSGKTEDAASALADCLRLQPGMTIKRLFDGWSVPLQVTSATYLRAHERIRSGLRIAGMPDA